jgi:hypothetical protein
MTVSPSAKKNTSDKQISTERGSVTNHIRACFPFAVHLFRSRSIVHNLKGDPIQPFTFDKNRTLEIEPAVIGSACDNRAFRSQPYILGCILPEHFTEKFFVTH